MSAPEGKQVSLSQMEPLMRQLLEQGQQVRFTPHGTSMLPMLRDGLDTVTLTKAQGSLKKYDVPLYRRPTGGYVLHRVVGENADGYLLCGDNQTQLEPSVRAEQVIGVVCAFTRKGREHTTDDFSYRVYARLRVASIPLRRFVGRCKRAAKRILLPKK